jgi:hypothetical protein
MPNWVYNNLSIEGTEEAIAKVKAQLNKPIVKQYGEDKEPTTYSNPIFSFWNILPPPEDKLEEYFGTHGFEDGKATGKLNTTGITSTTISGELSGMSQFLMAKVILRQK